jgi:hypothetical protein
MICKYIDFFLTWIILVSFYDLLGLYVSVPTDFYIPITNLCFLPRILENLAHWAVLCDNYQWAAFSPVAKLMEMFYH